MKSANLTAPSYWVIVERHENWLVDHADQFQQFGIPDRYEKRATEVRPADLLVTYVAGKAAFADVRRVRAPTIKKLRFGGNYIGAFSVALNTEPVFVAEPDHWVPAKNLAYNLGFVSKTSWGQSFRSTLRRIPTADGETIVNSIKRAIATAPKKI